MVVMGPQGSGVSSLIYRFINGANGWVAPATVDDFWHHVVRSKSEERITYYNITEVTGEEEYEGHRRSMLRRAQIVVLCFRLDRKMQFKRDVKRVWTCHAFGHDYLLTWPVCTAP
jgi:GTPase SAR1 family protein